MAEDQEQQTTDTLSYDSALKNKPLIDSMYYSLQAFGEKEVPYEPKAILDTFLTKKRYFDTNILSTYNVADDVKTKFDEDDKKLLAYALKESEKIPYFFEKGGAPSGKALVDYALAGISDPTNLLSAVAGMATLGTGTAATMAAKTAAQQTAKNLLKTKMTALVSKPVIKSLAVEGVVAGAGGAAQNYLAQETEQEIGLRTEKDPTEMVLQGALEGTLSPVLGALTNVLGSYTIKSAQDAIESFEVGRNATQWLRRNFLPTAGVTDPQRRNIEINSGIEQEIGERANDLESRFYKSYTKDLGRTMSQQDIDMINKSLELDTTAINQLYQASPKTASLLPEWFALKNEASHIALQSKLNAATKQIFTGNQHYVRDIFDKFTKVKREPFEEFLNNNPGVMTDFTNLVYADIHLPVNQKYFKHLTDNFVDSQGRYTLTNNEIDKMIRKEAETLYEPTRRFRKETGPFKQRISQQMPPVIKTILGYNNTPALRIHDTINGIVTTAMRSNLADKLGREAINSGVGFRGDMASARAFLKKDVVPLVAQEQYAASRLSPFKIPENMVDPNLKKYFVTKDYAKQLNELVSDTPFLDELQKSDTVLGASYRGVLGLQNFIKAGKTLYSPIAHMRNFVGMLGYTAASGNLLGLLRSVTDYATLPLSQREALWALFEKNGLKGSNIDFNQVSKRLTDLVLEGKEAGLLHKITNLGKTGKAVRNFYSLTDDIGKYAVMINEMAKTKKIFNAMTTQQQLDKLVDYTKAYSLDITDPDIVNKYIAEEAARKTANITPVYSRVSPILEKMRTIPIIGTFTAYPAERLRNTYNILKLSTDEMREGFQTGNKELLKAGVSRLGQWYVTQASLYSAAFLANEAAGETEFVEYLRSLLPDYKKNNAIVVTGRDKRGYPKYMDLSYIAQDQYVLDPAISIMMKASQGKDVSKDIDKAIKYSATKMMEPYIGPSLAVESASAFLGVAKGDFSQLDNLVKIIEPGYVRFARDMATDAKVLDGWVTGNAIDRFYNPRRFGEVVERPEHMLDLFKKNGLLPPGLREETFDVNKFVGFTLMNLSKSAQTNWNTFKKDTTTLLTDPTSFYDPKNVMKNYDEALKEQFVYQQGIMKLYNDMTKIIPPNKARKVLQSFDLRGVGISDKELTAILRGSFQFKTMTMDDKFWEDVDQSLKDKTNTSHRKELSGLKKELRKVDSFYSNRNLKKDPPDLEIK